MAQETIKCPKCGEAIKLSEAISQDIEVTIKAKYKKELEDRLEQERKQLEAKAKKEAQESVNVELADLKERLAEKDKKLSEVQKQELEFRKRERQIQEREENITKTIEEREKEINKKKESEIRLIEQKTRKEAKESQRMEITDLKTQLEEKTKRLERAEQEELEIRRRQREIEEREKAFELETTRRMDSERQQIRETVSREFEESHRFKNAEKDKQLADMKIQIEDLKRKADQASQKTQGEVLELELEQVLKDEFTFDDIDPVSSGVKGGDVIQTVKTRTGRTCGKILWETKRTKTWSDSWIEKIKDDQHKAKADLAIIVSEALPKGFSHFRQIEGIWVSDIPLVLSLSLVLRTMLIKVASTKEIQTGKEEKKEIVYNYLTGPEFKNRVQAIMDAFISMKKDLDTEKRAMEKNWAKREKQIEKVVLNIAGMHGDLEGIAGTSLPAIKTLELPADEPQIQTSEEGKKEEEAWLKE